MKRWPIILGRGGTVLLAVGLALLLVSFIPSVQSNVQEQSTVMTSASWQAYYVGIVTPQQTVDITIATNGTLDAYLLETWPSTVYDWISEHYPGLTDFPNVTYFDRFLNANPTLIAWQHEIHNENTDYEYVPATIVNMTVAISNHGPDSASIDYHSSLKSGVAPTAKVRLLSEFAIPVGAALTIPWLGELLMTKKEERPKRIEKKEERTTQRTLVSNEGRKSGSTTDDQAVGFRYTARLSST